MFTTLCFCSAGMNESLTFLFVKQCAFNSAARQAALARNLISDAGDEIRHLFLLERMAGFTIVSSSVMY